MYRARHGVHPGLAAAARALLPVRVLELPVRVHVVLIKTGLASSLAAKIMTHFR